MGSTDVHIRANNVNVELQTGTTFLSRTWSKLTKKPRVARTKHILNDVSFDIQGPSLTTIIGPSGCGKTTLLNTVSRQLENGTLKETGSTTIWVRGQHVNYDKRTIKEYVAYVRQEDTLYPSLTVRETLEYAADLSLKSSSKVERREAVERTIKALRLGNCANTYIGSSARKGCSGGEIRRTSIGVQLLKDQPILFLDEPTTGLDPKAASEVVQVLREIVNQGKTVIMTLHQPRSGIWDLVDNLMVMSQGSLLYSGGANQAWEHFAAQGCSMPAFENPFDVISDLIAVDTRNEKDEEIAQARVHGLKETWLSREVDAERGLSESISRPSSLRKPWKNSCQDLGRQLSTLCRRTLTLTFRDRLGVVASLVEGLSMGLACGIIFYQLSDDLSGIKSRAGALYCTSSMQNYLVLLFEIYRLTVDVPAFDHERADGMITPTAFYLSRRLTRLFIEDLTVPFIFSASFYFMAGLRPGASEFFSYYLVQLLLHLISVNLAVCCVLPTREILTAGLIANLNYVVQCLCSGLLINSQSFGDWVGWIRWTAPLYYGFGALCSIEFSGNVFDCPWPGDAANPQCREYTGDFIMASFGFPATWFRTPIAALSGLVVLFFALALGVLHLPHTRSAKLLNIKDDGLATRSTGPTARSGREVEVSLDQLRIDIGTNILPWLDKSSKAVVGPVTATFEPGTLNAVLGPSGSGKTSLLNAIAGRIHGPSLAKHKQTGHVRFNGHLINQGDVSSICSFVAQNQVGLLPHLTVRETLRYAARLRLPSSLSSAEKMARADTVLLDLGLKPCADTLIGDSQRRGVSCGERRRLAIAIQLLTNPSVLLLDEPTSGLDAFIASTIIETMQRLADEGRTIIMVVHQPRWAFMQACAKLLLLSCDGQPAFFGSPEELARQRMPLCNDEKETTVSLANPADLALDDLADGIFGKKDMCSEASSLSHHSIRTVRAADLDIGRVNTLTFARVLPILVQRAITNLIRAPILLAGRVAQIVGVGIVMVIFYTPIGYDYPSTQTRMGIIGQSSALFFVGMLNALTLYPAHLDFFLDEYQDGIYGVEPFLCAYTMIELPIELISSLLLALLFVFATGLSETATAYFLIAYTSFAVVNCGESLGIAFLSFIRHTGLAISIMSVVLSLCTALNGAFSLKLLNWVRALNHLSPAKWQVQVSAATGLKDVTFSCTASERLASGQCPISTGEELLQLYNLDVSITRAACILLAVTIGYRILAYLALKCRCKPWK